MLQSLLLGICTAILVYIVLKRCAGLLLSAAARNKHYKLSVGSVGPLIFQDIHLEIAQGPVAHIWISEVSLGHSRSATKVARAAMSWHFRIPFTVRDLTLELRNSPAVSRKRPKPASKSKPGSKLLLNSGLRLLLGVLPNIPIRIKQLTVKHKAIGFLLDIPRVEVLMNSSRLTSKLKIDVKLLPIKALLESAPGRTIEHHNNSRLLELQHVTSCVKLQVTNQSLGLHCISASVEVGNAVFTASEALLSALTVLAATSKQQKAISAKASSSQPDTKQSRAKPLTAAAFAKVVALLPDQVQISIPSVCIQTNGVQASAGFLQANVENRNLVLSAARASKPPPLDPLAPTSQHPLAGSSEEQLYVISVTSGGAHAGLGLVDQPPASTVSINSASMELRLNSNVPMPSAYVLVGNTAAAVLRAHIDFAGVSTQCCPAMLWPVVATLQQIHQQVQQQALQQGRNPGSFMPAALDAQPREGELRQRTVTGDALAADKSGHVSMDSTAQRSAVDIQDEAVQAAAAAASAAEAALGIQWELCMQTSSHCQLEVVGEAGDALLSCGVDMVTVRAASGDGSSMHAESAADLVLQLSVQGLQFQMMTRERNPQGELMPALMKQLLALQKAGLGVSTKSRQGTLCCTGNLTVTGCEAHLMHAMLLDLASLGLSLLPPKGLLKKQKPLQSAATDPLGSQHHTVDTIGRTAKPKLAMQVTKVTVGITNLVVGYQTAVQVAAVDLLHGRNSSVALAVTQCITLQELVAEAYPLAHSGALQMSNLMVMHQEAESGRAPAVSHSGHSRHQHHEVEVLRAAHLSMRVDAAAEDAKAVPALFSASQGNVSGNSARSTQGVQDLADRQMPRLAVIIGLGGWRTTFHADAVIGMCKAAGDFASVAGQTAAHLKVVSSDSVDINSRPAKVPAVDSPETAAAAAGAAAPVQGKQAVISTKLSKLQKLPVVKLVVEIDRWHTDIIIADHIVWGIRVAELQLKLDSRTVLALQQQHLQMQLTQHTQAVELSGPRPQPLEQAHKLEAGKLNQSAGQIAEVQQQPENESLQQHDAQQEQSSEELLASIQRPSVTARIILLTLNRKTLLQCGEIDASLNLSPKHAKHSMSRALSSSTSLGSPRRQASLDWSQSGDEQAAAYTRAGLPHWAAHCLSEPGSPTTSSSHTDGAANQMPISPALAEKPSAIVQATVCDVMLTLPHDQDFGRAERYVELWSKAFGQVLQQQLLSLKKSPGQRKSKAQDPGLNVKSILLPMELRLVLQGAVVKFEHHSLEAWMATHAPMLRDLACQDAMWARAVAADSPNPDDAASESSQTQAPGQEQFVQEFSAEGPARLQSQQAALDALSIERARQYKSLCDQLRQQRKDDTKQGALMHVTVEGAQARLIVLSSDAATTQTALDFIAQVDPSSQGVPMRQVQKLHVDVGVQGVAVDFCGNPQPLATATSAQFYGTIAVGRQVTAPPQLYDRRMAVGRHRHPKVAVTVKGSRALVKVYTEVNLRVQQANACYGVGLEPVIAMVSQAGKRLSPTDPDKSRPKPAVLPWWDMMRFTWRGGIAITAEEFEFSLLSGPNLADMAVTERLQVSAGIATVQLAYGGKLIVETTDLTAQGLKAAGLGRPVGTMLALPLLDFPNGHITLSSNWRLPNGRNGNQHHLFPVELPTDPDARQGPMLPADHFKSSGLDVDLQVVVGSLSAVTEHQGADRSLHREQSGANAESSAIVFLGDHQVVFMKEMIAGLQQPPSWLKFPVRFGTYFLPVDKRRALSAKLPRLLDHFDISVRACPLDVVHYTVDPEDPSNGVCLAMVSGAWQGNMLMNQPSPRTARPGASTAEQIRQASRVATKMLSMTVQVEQLRITDNDAGLDDAIADAGSQGRLLELMSGGADTTPPPTSYRHLLGAPSTEDFIVSIDRVTLTQAPASIDSSKQDHRPLKAQVHNCQLLVDLAGRNALWGAAAHLFMAFKPLVPNPPPTPSVAPASPTPAQASHLQKAPSGLQQGGSGLSRMGSQKGSMGATPLADSKLLSQDSFTQGQELLQILSQQDQQASGPSGAGPREALPPMPEDRQGSSALPDQAEAEVQEPVAVAAARLVGDADGAPTDGQDTELHDALTAETEHMDMVQAEQERKTAVEAQSSRVTFEVEVLHFQAYLQAEMAPGRFLLAAEKGRVEGRSMPHLLQNLTTLTLDQVQAHVAQTEVDPGAAVAWLRVTDAGMQASPSATQLIRRVFDPFKIQLRICQPTGHASANGATLNSTQSKASARAKGLASQGQEIRLVVPEIGVMMDSREFEVLTDVISNVGMAQGPHVDSVVQDKRLLLGQGPAEGPSVEGAREMFAYLSQYLTSLEAEAFSVRSKLDVTMLRQASSRSVSGPSHSGNEHLHRAFHITQEPNSIDELADVPTALHNYFQTLVQSQQDGLDHNRLVSQGEGLLVRWAQEQSQAALQGLHTAREALLDLQAQSQKQRQNQNAKRFTLELDAIKWHLCQDRTPFVEASIVGVMLDSRQNKDLSGSSKLVIQRVEVKDRQGLVGEAPGLEPGMVVSAWNPDESWIQDALLRVNATKGVPTLDLNVWSLVDVMVHPLGVHIHQQVANSLWDYFFPKEDAAAKQRQQQWAKSVALKRKTAAVVGETEKPAFHASSKGGLGASGHSSRGAGGSGSTTASQAADKALASAGSGQGSPPHSPSATSPVFSLGRRRHRRISSWDEKADVRKGMVDPALISPASSGELSVTRPKASSSVFRRLHRRSASHGEEPATAAPLSGSGPLSPAFAKKKVERSVAKRKKLLFVHFRINRVHCRVTYKGAPFNIKDFKVLLDAQVYEDLEGRWVDLFNRMKWDIIKSVLKSVAGLQGRKFKELLPDHLLKEAKVAADKGKGTGVQWPFGWGKKKSEKDLEAIPTPEAEVLKARQKKKMMFGEQHLVRFGSVSRPAGTDPPVILQDSDLDPPQGSATSSGSAASELPSTSAASRARAFVNRALASAKPSTNNPQRSPLDQPHFPEAAADSTHSLEPRHDSRLSVASFQSEGPAHPSGDPQHQSWDMSSQDNALLQESGNVHHQSMLGQPQGTETWTAVQHQLTDQQVRGMDTASMAREGPPAQLLQAPILEQLWNSATVPQEEMSFRHFAVEHNCCQPVADVSDPERQQDVGGSIDDAAGQIIRDTAANEQLLTNPGQEQQLVRQLRQQPSGNPFQAAAMASLASDASTHDAGIPSSLLGTDRSLLGMQASPDNPFTARNADDGVGQLSETDASLLNHLGPDTFSSTQPETRTAAELVSGAADLTSHQFAPGEHMQADMASRLEQAGNPPASLQEAAGHMNVASKPDSSMHSAMSLAQMLADLPPAVSREPRRSGNPFLDDHDDDDDSNGNVGVHVESAPQPALQASTAATADMPQAATGLTRSSQAEELHGSRSATNAPDTQMQSQQALKEAPSPEQPRALAPIAAAGSMAPQASDTDMHRQLSGRNLGQLSSSRQLDSSGSLGRELALQAGSLGDQSVGLQEPILPVRDAAPLSNTELVPAAAQTVSRQQSSMAQDTAAIQRSSMATAQQAVSANQSAERQASGLNVQPEVAQMPLHLDSAGGPPLEQLPLPSGSVLPQSEHSERLRQQTAGVRPTMGFTQQAVDPVHGQQETPPMYLQAAAPQMPFSLPVQGQGALDRAGAEAAVPLQKQQQQHQHQHQSNALPPASGSQPHDLSSTGQQGRQPAQGQGLHQEMGLEGMLGRAAPDSDTEEEESAASAQDRQRFMQSLQSPDRGASRTKNLAKGFGRMRAKAKDMLQTRSAGSPPAGRPAPQAPSQGATAEASQIPTDAELGRGGRFARDMTMMFAGLKKPSGTNQQ